MKTLDTNALALSVLRHCDPASFSCPPPSPVKRAVNLPYSYVSAFGSGRAVGGGGSIPAARMTS